MPLPTPNSGESEDHFMERCMSNPTMMRDYPKQKQRLAVCYSQFRGKKTDDSLIVLAQKTQAVIDDMIAKGWLPAGMTQNDLDDGDFAWLSNAYKAGKESKSTGRKLPYKIHGKVNSNGWKAAMAACQGARGRMSFSGGPSKAQVERKLCRDKPKEVNSTVCDNGGKQAKMALSKEQLSIVEDAIEKGKQLRNQLGIAKIHDFKQRVARAIVKEYQYHAKDFPTGLLCSHCNRSFDVEGEAIFELVTAQFNDATVICEMVCEKCYNEAAEAGQLIEVIKQRIKKMLAGLRKK